MSQSGPNDPAYGIQPPPGAPQAPNAGYGQQNWQQGQQNWQHGQPYAQPYQPRSTSGMAIAAIIVTFVFPPVGLVLGLIARSQIRQTGEEGEGLATAAIIVSSVLIGLWVLGIIAFIGLFAAVSSNIHGVSGVTGTTIRGITP